jgi:hypothetical protein
VIVQDVVGLIPGDIGLEEPEAVGMDGADKQPAELVERRSAQPPFGPLGDPLSKLARRSLGERERDDRASRDTIGQQVGDPLRHDLGLARPGRRDDLQMAAAVPNCRQRRTLKPRPTHHWYLLPPILGLP